MSAQSYFNQYESPNIVIVPNDNIISRNDPPAKRRRIENNIIVPIVDSVTTVTCTNNKVTHQEQPVPSTSAIKETDKKSILTSPTITKTSWASNYLQSIGMTPKSTKSSIWQHKIPRKSTTRKPENNILPAITDDKSEVTVPDINIVKTEKSDQFNNPNKIVVDTNNFDKKDTKPQINSRKSITAEDLQLKENVSLIATRNLKKNDSNISRKNKNKNIIAASKKTTANKILPQLNCNNCKSFIEERDVYKKPKTIRNKESSEDKILSSKPKKTHKAKRVNNEIVSNIKSVIVKPSKKIKQLCCTDKKTQNKIKANPSTIHHTTIKPSTSTISNDVNKNIFERRNTLGEVTSVKSILQVTKKYDINNLKKMLPSNKMKTNNMKTKNNTKTDDSRESSKATSSKETKKFSSSKQNTISKSCIKKPAHNTRTYKKIKLVINVICNQQKSQSDPDNKGIDVDKASASSNIELDFLNDIDIDEIVECLDICDKETNKCINEMQIEERKAQNGNSSTHVGLDNNTHTDAMDLIKILNGEEDDDLIRQSIETRNDILFGNNIYQTSQQDEHYNVKVEAGCVPDIETKTPVKIKEEKERLDMFTKTKFTAPRAISNIQNNKINKNDCKKNTQNKLIDNQDPLNLKHNETDFGNENSLPMNESTEKRDKITNIYNNTCSQRQNVLKRNAETVTDINTKKGPQKKSSKLGEFEHDIFLGCVKESKLVHDENNVSNLEETKLNNKNNNEQSQESELLFCNKKIDNKVEDNIENSTQENNVINDFKCIQNEDSKETQILKYASETNSFANSCSYKSTNEVKNIDKNEKLMNLKQDENYRGDYVHVINLGVTRCKCNNKYKNPVFEKSPKTDDEPHIYGIKIQNKDKKYKNNIDTSIEPIKQDDEEKKSSQVTTQKLDVILRLTQDVINNVKPVKYDMNLQKLADTGSNKRDRHLDISDYVENNAFDKNKRLEIEASSESCCNKGDNNDHHIKKDINNPLSIKECTSKTDTSDNQSLFIDSRDTLLSLSYNSQLDVKVATEIEEKIHKGLGLPYSVTSLIHKGKFSTIFSCKRQNGKLYALKIINRFTDSMEDKKLMWESLQNYIPRINLFTVYLVNAFKSEKKWYILMEYYPKNLAQVLEDVEISFCIELIQDYARQLVTAVVFLKNNNMVHTDIKPGHILLNSSHTSLKLCGLDNLCYSNNIAPLPNVGTPNYRAPEIILGYPAGFEIDVWSTGVVLFEIATKMKLFPGIYNNDILYKQICTLGCVPYDMIIKSRYASYHYIGTKFMRRTGPGGKEYDIIKKFPKNKKLYKSIYGTYFQNWGHQKSRTQLINDKVKLGVLLKLLQKMLVIHPKHRLSIEFVFDNEFIYDAYKYQEW